MTYCSYVKMKGLCPNFDYSDGSRRKCYLSDRGVLYLAQRGVFFQVPEETINDKAKADSLAKALVCLQVTWTVIQATSKKAVGYPISLLEVHTLVHVVCALGLYALWFKKPLGIREPTIVESAEFREHLDVFLDAINLLHDHNPNSPRLLRSYMRELEPTVLTKHLELHESTMKKLAFMLVMVCTTGAIHISAWDFVFPSQVEKLLWRICSIIAVSVPILVVLTVLLAMFCSYIFLKSPRLSRYVKQLRSVMYVSILFIPAFVIPCRLFFVVESFISIRHVPVGVYATVPWTKYIPHL